MKIFCASTGRAGTLFCSEIMRKLTCVPSFHEPQPWCVDDTLREVNDLPGAKHSAATTAELEEKWSQVQRDAMDGWYFESNQMFIKSYMQLFALDDIGVIYLWRNPMDVLLSYAKKCQRREAGWFLQSHWRFNHLRTTEPLSFYENVLWQWYEVRERYMRAREHFGKTYELDFRRLNEPEDWKKLFKHFGIPHRDFTHLPNVKRNEILGDDGAEVAKLRRDWAEAGTIPANSYVFQQREKYIDFAQRAVARNAAEVNRCET